MIEAMWTPWEGPGLEHLRLTTDATGRRAESLVLGVDETGMSFRLRYDIRCDPAWRVREVRAEILGGSGRAFHLLADGEGNWRDGDGAPLPELAGSIDVDLTATPFTNTLPIRRLGLGPGESAEIAVAWIEAPALRVFHGRQRYTRLGPGDLSDAPRPTSAEIGSAAVGWYRYESIESDFVALLPVDGEGMVLDYPGLFRRVWSGGDVPRHAR